MASNSRRVTARRNSLLLRLNGSEFPLVAFRRSARGKTDNQGCPVSVGGAPQGYSLPPPSLSTMKSPSRVVRSKTVFQGCLIRVDVDRVREPGGVEADREIIRHSGSVVLLPVFPGGKVLLVRQFRYAAQRALWELPAGRREPGETILQAARRELAEETGFRPARLKRLLSFYASPGFLDEKMHLVRATDLRSVGASPDEDERITSRLFSSRDLRKLLSTGKILDGKTLVGLLCHLKKLH
jgi:ADP-ribose pyrophosphatase